MKKEYYRSVFVLTLIALACSSIVYVVYQMTMR